jgi:hypothetical protein
VLRCRQLLIPSIFMRTQIFTLASLIALTLFICAPLSFAHADTYPIRVSVATDGTQGNSPSHSPVISGDSRYVLFSSSATNLDGGTLGLFLHDTQTGSTTRISTDDSAGHSLSADGRYIADSSNVYDMVTGTATPFDVASDGTPGNAETLGGNISSDGRYVAFASGANNLVPGDTNGRNDIFVHDMVTGSTTRVSVTSDGTQGNDSSINPAISADGHYVAFLSNASNLVPNDTNNHFTDVFVHDMLTGSTTLASASSDGIQTNNSAEPPAISADGRYIAFGTAGSLSPVDVGSGNDIYVHDTLTGSTTLASVSSDGTQIGNGGDGLGGVIPSISADGRYVAFPTRSANLVPNDTNGVFDIFVHDMLTGKTTRVSVASDGTQGNGATGNTAAISADGRYVAFDSRASNLVPGDTNAVSDVFLTPNPLFGANQPPVLAPIGDKTTEEGQPLQFTISGSDPDGNNLTYSASNLPSGATFNSSTRTFSWTPATGQAGTYPNVTFTVTDDGVPPASASEAITITVTPPPSITTTSLPEAANGVAYSQTIQTTGGTTPFSWSITSGTLSAGLSLNASTGVISGTPTTNGTSNFTVQVTDSNSISATKNLSIVVANPLSVTTNALPAGKLAVAYTKTVVATGGTTSYTWSVASGTLPGGLSLNPSTGVISGTPTAAGTFSFTLQVADALSQTITKSFTLNINSFRITTNTLPNGKLGNPYSKTLAAAAGTKPYTWSVIGGALPNGLSLDTSTGIIAGTPTTAGTANVTIQANDSNSQTDSESYTLKVTSTAITTNTVPNGVVGATYSKNLVATGGVTPYSWSVIGGSLAPGLSLSTTGSITGTPTTAGPFTFTVQVSDANSETDTATYTATTTQTTITTAALPNGKVGNAYSKTMAANNGTSPYTWTVTSGALPAGLSLSSAGVISGTPTTAGTVSVTIQATDANAVTDAQMYSLNVNP